MPKKWSQRERIETQIMEKKPVCEVQILAGFQHSAKRAPKLMAGRNPRFFFYAKILIFCMQRVCNVADFSRF